MSRKYEAPLQIQVKPSRQRRLLLFCLFALICCAIVLLSTSTLLKLLLFFVASAVLLREYRANTHYTLHRQAHAGWRLQGDGLQLDGEVLGTSVVTRCFMIVHFRHAEGARQLLVMPDSVDAESWRRLRVWLRIEAVGRSVC